MTVYALL